MGGAGDQAAQAVGVGAVEPGIIALTLGTSRGCLCTNRISFDRTGGSPACFLPCIAGSLAFYGSHAQRSGQSAVGIAIRSPLK